MVADVASGFDYRPMARSRIAGGSDPSDVPARSPRRRIGPLRRQSAAATGLWSPMWPAGSTIGRWRGMPGSIEAAAAQAAAYSRCSLCTDCSAAATSYAGRRPRRGIGGTRGAVRRACPGVSRRRRRRQRRTHDAVCAPIAARQRHRMRAAHRGCRSTVVQFHPECDSHRRGGQPHYWPTWRSAWLSDGRKTISLVRRLAAHRGCRSTVVQFHPECDSHRRGGQPHYWPTWRWAPWCGCPRCPGSDRAGGDAPAAVLAAALAVAVLAR